VDIKSFQQQVKELSQHLDTKSPERRMMYLVSELGEVVDEVIELTSADKDTPQETITDIKERLGLEIYDLIWNAIDLANILEIDLEDSFQKKITINEKRRWSSSGFIDTGD
jgi:NTP pyrophosphatase (non-canonical NTP hydrolase)